MPCPSHGCLKKSSQLHCLVGSGWPLLRRASHFLRPILHPVVQEVLPTPTICDIWKRSNANLLSQSTGMDEGAVEDSYIYIYLSLSPSFLPSLPPSLPLSSPKTDLRNLFLYHPLPASCLTFFHQDSARHSPSLSSCKCPSLIASRLTSTSINNTCKVRQNDGTLFTIHIHHCLAKLHYITPMSRYDLASSGNNQSTHTLATY